VFTKLIEEPMMGNVRRPTALVLMIVVAGCSPKRETPPPEPAPPSGVQVWTDSSAHQVHAVAVNGTRISYLDWGGSGEPLVYIHGLGDSPHSFDDLAPALADRLRVIAYARRGHGRSDSNGPFDNGTLVEDLRQLLDSLKIAKAHLAGWSMGGNEITEFAIRYPDRVGKLVFFDTGYDWSDRRWQAATGRFPLSFTPDSAALRSFEAFRAWQKRTAWPDVEWTRAMEAETRDVVELQPDGSVRPRQNDSLMTALFASLSGYHPDHSKLRAPVLSLHAERFLAEIHPDSATRASVHAWNESLAPFFAESRKRLARQVRGIRIVILPGTSHPSLPFQAHDSTVAELRGFLLAAGPR
jgi:pimeloyl-ACP methyl ester carboxylesterase